MIIKLEMPNPTPYSSNADVSKCWAIKQTISTNINPNGTQNTNVTPINNTNNQKSIAEQLNSISSLTTSNLETTQY